MRVRVRVRHHAREQCARLFEELLDLQALLELVELLDFRERRLVRVRVGVGLRLRLRLRQRPRLRLRAQRQVHGPRRLTLSAAYYGMLLQLLLGSERPRRPLGNA